MVSGARRRLTFPQGEDFVDSDPTFSPDGKELILMGRSSLQERVRPFRASSGGGTVKPLPFGERASNIAWARQHGIDLMLSGHVHGGQIRLPLVGSIFVPSWYGSKYDCGTFYEAPTVMHVSRGLAGQHPLRFFCKPEVTRIILRKTV